MLQPAPPQGETWNIIVQAISLLASMASLAMAVVAIWLSFKFYIMSIHSSEKTEEASRAIGASVERLEKVFQMQYSDTFSMVRDTYSDFRKRLLTDNKLGEQSEKLAETKADEKLDGVRMEIQAELSKVVDKVGKTDAELNAVRKELAAVIDKAILRSRVVEKEAREETLKDSILRFIRENPREEWNTWHILERFEPQFSPTDIGKALLELRRDGVVKFSSRVRSVASMAINEPFTVLP